MEGKGESEGPGSARKLGREKFVGDHDNVISLGVGGGVLSIDEGDLHGIRHHTGEGTHSVPDGAQG